MAAQAEKQPFSALLPAGFHPTDLAGLRRLCVDYFPGSAGRAGIMQTITTMVTLINRSSIPARLWIGGSFLTEDPHPEDFALLMVLVGSVHRDLGHEQRDFFNWFRTQPLYDQYRCENYGIVIDADRGDFPLLQTYWMRQFHFDRGRQQMGIAEILVPMLARS